ncbi:winged helix DNA-binding protein [Candidatus Galacturonibacter soehngenii]|uniref:MarR family transcriptional regulator n=1 Tax=Candidatus Galacturonatibacter soehngenii TaxID=2307010 RepID=A0A7V7UB74_9FIRM|nr:winged helix DNA-binding protein [Candidatus Galacturonibacter soehngenii]KAB1436027.1 MarR family transcriptional regulator [Candidatus Galacturonibacter soehngenii]
MNSKNELIQKFHQAANIMLCDARTSRCYGTEYALTYSDLSFLKCIQRNENNKAGDISQYLGITNGAVVQLAKKLEGKGYLESYRMEGNKKEVYYRLTKSGQTACEGYDKYNDDINALIEAYIIDLDEDTLGTIKGLFEAVITGIEKKDCYIKYSSKTKQLESKKDGRCEKCKRTY